MPEIKLDTDGFAYLRICAYRKGTAIPIPEFLYYKVDSGANSTTIGKDDLNRLGYDDAFIKTGKLLVGKERPTVATGEPIDNCYKFIIPEVRIGIWKGSCWSFLVSMNNNVQFKLLFGTDSMRFFNWEFDYERNVCIYNAINGKKLVIHDNIEQSIHSIDDVH